MASKPPVAVYDACVLYPFHLRNVLVQCAFDGLVEARWSDDIHDEWIRNLAANTPSLSIERLIATRDRMKAVLPEADVTTYRPLVNDLKLPDPGDRHIAAAPLRRLFPQPKEDVMNEIPRSCPAADAPENLALKPFMFGSI